MKKELIVWAMILSVGLTAGAAASEKGSMKGSAKTEVALNDKAVLDVVRETLMKKMMQSGTLDIYDSQKDEVRNLRTVKFAEEVQETEEGFVAVVKYRDTNSGDIVDVEVLVVHDGEQLQVSDIKMKAVSPLKKDKVEEDREYTDEEIQAFMQEYLVQQAKFTGTVMLYDEERSKMRQLKLIELSPEVRRMGIFYNSRGTFEDEATGDVLGIDVAVQKKKGVLKVQALRIRDVKRNKQ